MAMGFIRFYGDGMDGERALESYKDAGPLDRFVTDRYSKLTLTKKI